MLASGCGDVPEPTLEDPRGLVDSFSVRPLSDYGVTAEGLPLEAAIVAAAEARVVVAYPATPCDQAPAVSVFRRSGSNVIDIEIVDRTECDLPALEWWGVEINFVEPPGDRDVRVTLFGSD